MAAVMLNGTLHLQPAFPIGLNPIYSVHTSKFNVFQTCLRSLEHLSGTTSISYVQFLTQVDAFDPVFL